MKRIIAEIVFLLFLYSTAVGQTNELINFVPERPGMATPPNIMALKSFEVEDGFLFENYTDGFERYQSFLFSSLLLRYGISENAEIRIQTDYAWFKKDGVTSSVIYGLNPITIGTKVKILEQRKVLPNLSLLLNLTLPFICKNEFRPENVAPSFYILMSNSLSENVNLCYNYGMIWDGSSSVPTHFYVIDLELNLNDKLCTFIEGYGYSSQHAKSEFYIDAGLAYLINDHLQIDLSAAGFLNSFTDYYLLNVGIAWQISGK